jgi:glutathione S-transferase
VAHWHGADKTSFPLAPGSEIYTIPTVRFPDGKYMMDSLEIAKHIEANYPSPSIDFDWSFTEKIQGLINELMALGTGVRGVFLITCPERLLNPRSVEYWIDTRSKKLQKPLSELTPDERGGKAWDHASRTLQKVTELLKEKSGPFFKGDTVCYADFCWAGFLLFMGRQGEDVFEKMISVSGDVQGKDNVHLKLLEAVKPWSARDDH